ARSMTTADDPHPRREQEPRRERLRRRAATISGVTTSLLLTMAVGGTIASDTGRALLPGWLSSFGVALGFVVTVAIIWRHQYPGLLTGFALLPPVLAGPSLPALIALAALAASRRDRYLWLATGGVFVTTAWTLWLDTQRSVPGSVLQLPFGAQEGGPPVDVPVIAPVLFAVLLTGIPVAVGLLRGANRDLARGAHARQELRDEVARKDERTRIAREMHDVLGHRLSQLSLQAGALEAGAQDNPETAQNAQTVR